MVNNITNTKLFTPENVKRFSKKHCKLLYSILGEVLPHNEEEHATIGLALNPSSALEMCEDCMGNAIEVWVIDGDKAVLSEKWDPQYFKDHFTDVVEYTSPTEEPTDEFDHDDDEDTDEELRPKQGGIGVELPPDIVMGKSLLEILECEQQISKCTAAASFMAGHPVDLDFLFTSLHTSIAEILKAFAQSKGGFEPKFRIKGGVMIPYWTKTQIKQAKSKKS